MTTPITWRALNQIGIAHAFPGKGPALCGVANVDPRYDWPRRTRCSDCQRASEAKWPFRQDRTA